MSIKISKAKSATGVALVSAILAGCGGGGGGSTAVNAPPPGGLTQGTTNCTAIAGGETISASIGAVIGSCEEYTASTSPTKVATAFKSPGTNSPVLFNSTTGYAVSLPILANTSTAIPLANELRLSGGLQAYSLGNYAGRTFQTVLDQNTGAAATVYDLTNTLNVQGTKFMDLNSSRYGVFSRFGDRTLGFYGGWANLSNTASVPLSGVVTFRGSVVGVVGPGATNAGLATAAGYSAEASITIDFSKASGSVTNIALSNFGYSANGTQLSSQVILPITAATTALVSSSVDSATNAKSVSASFSSIDAGASKGFQSAALSGSFAGTGAIAPNELVGTIKFVTTDGRNGIGAFGVKASTTPLLNP